MEEYLPQPKRDIDEEKKKIRESLENIYNSRVKQKVQQMQHRNILFLGRAKAGKSTIISVLADPRYISAERNIFGATTNPISHSYAITDDNIILHLIDTPGLFEVSSKSDKDKARANETILDMIMAYLSQEIIKMHLICFVISYAALAMEDIRTIRELIDFFGETICKNACLIITHCESKSSEQCVDIEKQLKDYPDLPMECYSNGIYFSGAINIDSWNNALDSVYTDFANVCFYRRELIELFITEVQPVGINEINVKGFQRKIEENKRLQHSLDVLKEETEHTVQNLRQVSELEKQQSSEKIQQLTKENIRLNESLEKRTTQLEQLNETNKRLKAETDRLVQRLDQQAESHKQELRQLKQTHEADRQQLNDLIERRFLDQRRNDGRSMYCDYEPLLSKMKEDKQQSS